MTESNMNVKQLFIYPIKGLTPQACERVILQVGHGIPGDRGFALMYVENGKAPASETPWRPKGNFAMQNDWPGLAALNCQYHQPTGILTVQHQGTTLLEADLHHSFGRDQISTFFTGYLAALHPTETARHPEKAPLQLVGNGAQTRYPDREPVHISLLSQGTLDALAEAVGEAVDVCRFRPNVLLDGVPAWEEFNWVGKELQLGDCRIAVTARIGRCVNIDVNPQTGRRDLPLLSTLQAKFGHAQTGILAKVLVGGSVACGDEILSLE